MTAKEFRTEVVEAFARKRLLVADGNAKTVKGRAKGYMTGIMYLAPADEAGRGTVCSMSSAGCREACLFTAGHGRFDSVRDARITKTNLWFDDRKAFMHNLILDIISVVEKAEREGLTPCIRLNGTSDIMWEKQKYKGKTLFQWFPDLQFYDYTKIWTRFSKKLPDNYHLTFSRSEENDALIAKVLRLAPDANVAVVFSGELPETWNGMEVINSDQDDLRFLDPKGVVCGLKAKGDAKKDKSGFVVQYQLMDIVPLGKKKKVEAAAA